MAASCKRLCALNFETPKDIEVERVIYFDYKYSFDPER